MGVTKLFTLEFRCEPTLSDNSLKIKFFKYLTVSRALSAISSFFDPSAALSGQTILGRSGMSFSLDC